MKWIFLPSLCCCFACRDTTKDSSDAIVDTEDTENREIAISMDSIHRHLEALQEIANRNNQTRVVGSTGSQESIVYVQGVLENLGYTVTLQPFALPMYLENAPPVVRFSGEDFPASTMYYSPAGNITASIQPVDIQIPPGNQANSSTSGCELSDFQTFVPGNIALIQRGTCTYSTKIQFAQQSGASAVVFFNEGQADRRDVVQGTLGQGDFLIPAVGVSFDTGQLLAQANDVVTVIVDAQLQNIETSNVLAENTAGSEDSVLIIGGHLDSVQAGPGINDNGSGSAAILALAEWFADKETTNRIRFAFWSAEELGLIGSTYYVEQLAQDQANKIMANLNFDMLASPNYARFIYDGNGDSMGIPGPNGSGIIESLFEEHFTGAGLAFEATAFDGRSDYGPFIAINIPAGGLFSGAEQLKNASQQALYGGEADVPFDICYHQSCDTLDNINWTAMQEMGDASLSVAWSMATMDNFTGRNHRDIQQLRRNMAKMQYLGDKSQR